jgi:NAD(P)-dependent dehydrogenase (short-subunit alcohol dehydrogenase family)
LNAASASTTTSTSTKGNRVALVTGAGKRLGRSIALHLARCGWDVAIHFHHSEADAHETVRLCRSQGVQSEAFGADLSDESACRGLVDRIVEPFGRLHAVVNNASLFDEDGIHDFTFASMEAHWRVNAGAPLILAARLAAHVRARNGAGCVVNVLDQKLWNPNPDHLSYSMSKAALQYATTSLAMALAPEVRVVGIAPGVTIPSPVMSDRQFEAAHAMTPLQRSSRPEDIARAVAYLLDAEAVTGTTLLVDGGQHLMHLSRDVVHLTADLGNPSSTGAPPITPK